MNIATILIIVLTHQGCWFGGSDNEVDLRWAAKAGMPAADLHWELLVGNLKLASGDTPMAQDPMATVVHIRPPEVRIRVEMRWTYVLTAHDGGKELDRGERSIDVFPDSPFDGLARRVGHSRVVIWEKSPDLAGVFNLAKVPYLAGTDLTRISFTRPDAILVGPDALDPSRFTQGPLIDLTRAGTSIMIFRQTRVTDLVGHDVVRRDRPARLHWLTDHPLLRSFDGKLLDAIDMPTDCLPVRLPADEAALAIAAWPREIPGESPVAIDALLVSKSIGKGRIVLCQLPLTDWQHDPRAAMLLVNAVDYLLSPTTPTLPAGERIIPRPAELTRVSTITIPPGDR